MTWREHTVVAILLLVARIIGDDPEFRREVKNIATNISVHGGRV